MCKTASQGKAAVEGKAQLSAPKCPGGAGRGD